MEINFDKKLDDYEEEAKMLDWAAYSIARTLRFNGCDEEETEEKTSEVLNNIVDGILGNKDERTVITPLDWESIFESVINWVATNKDGFVYY